MKYLPFSLLTLLFLSCNSNSQTSNDKEAFYLQLAPQEFADKLKSLENAILLDVRTPEEYNSKHIGNATNINFNAPNFDQEIAKLDKSKTILVYCLGGGRSAAAAQKMQAMGFNAIYELKGGMMNWNASGMDSGISEKSGLNKAEFDKLLVSDKEVLVDFYAEWCAPCKKMEPTLKKLEQEGSIKLLRIDVDKNQNLAKELKVDALPTLELFSNGTSLWRNIGFLTENDLRSRL